MTASRSPASLSSPRSAWPRTPGQGSDIYVIGRDNVIWLINYYQGLRKGWPFDMIVIDEMSSFKNPQAKRFRALKKAMPSVSRVVGLTGTPTG